MLFHITARFLDKPDLIEAAFFAFPLTILALNLHRGDFEALAKKSSLCEPAAEHVPFCNMQNRGYAFYYFINMLVAHNGEWGTPAEALAVLLSELGYNSWSCFAAMLKAAATDSALRRGRNCRGSWNEARAKPLSEPK